MHWDKEVTQQLIQHGLTRAQAGFVIGILAEHRQAADMVGYTRGYNDGYREAKESIDPYNSEQCTHANTMVK
jgi:hypothetical protein